MLRAMRTGSADAVLSHPAFPRGVDREELIRWYRRNRARTASLFEIPTDDAYYTRPIELRNPIVFYEGHIPAFGVNTIVKRAMGRRGIDENLERLFERGIDPESTDEVRDTTWPDRETVRAYADEADRLIEAALREDCDPEAIFAVLEHEPMHQETFLYMLHNLPYGLKRATNFDAAESAALLTSQTVVSIPAGRVTLGAKNTFGWDNEFPAMTEDVPAFAMQRLNVTNGDYLEYVSATGARAPHFWARQDDRWMWRGMFELGPLPLDWPVYVTHDEATAYAQWAGGRLPTEAEYTRAVEGTPLNGNFDFKRFDPAPVGSGSASKWGIYDLIGNGWEWTSTVFAGFPGFTPMRSYPQYSADFFDGAHFVLKGGSPVTARELVRTSFRNWFRPNYPYLYATFRVVF